MNAEIAEAPAVDASKYGHQTAEVTAPCVLQTNIITTHPSRQTQSIIAVVFSTIVIITIIAYQLVIIREKAIILGIHKKSR